MPWWLARTVSWVLGINALVAGWDYLHTPQRTAMSLTMVERIATLHTWGWMYVVASLILMLGLAVNRHALVWLGHFTLALLYVGFTVATSQAVWEIMTAPEPPPTGSIWRAIPAVALPAVLHIILCGMRGVIPRRGGDA